MQPPTSLRALFNCPCPITPYTPNSGQIELPPHVILPAKPVYAARAAFTSLSAVMIFSH